MRANIYPPGRLRREGRDKMSQVKKKRSLAKEITVESDRPRQRRLVKVGVMLD